MISDFYEQYDIQKYESDIPTNNFDCGDEDLNDFIKNEVNFYKQQLIAMAYVVVEKGKTDKIIAYFTLSNDKIAVTDFESNSQFYKFKKKIRTDFAFGISVRIFHIIKPPINSCMLSDVYGERRDNE